MVRLAATSPFALVLAAAAVFLTGCFDTSSTITALDYPTLLTVDPISFRGRLPCGAPGLARYVVTIFDVSREPPTGCPSPPCPHEPTATSLPVLCQHQMSFGEPPLETPHYYIAIIEGYNREEVQQKQPGSRDMYDPSSDEIIPPTWMTTCGELPPPRPEEDAEADATADAAPYNPLRFPTLVLGKAEVFLHGCIPFRDASKLDASVDDGSAPPDDASADAEPPHDVSLETGDAAAPEDAGSEPEDAAEGGVEDGRGGDDGATEASEEGGEDGG
jgi:hypothetical protein